MKRIFLVLSTLFLCCNVIAQDKIPLTQSLKMYPKFKVYEGVYRFCPPSFFCVKMENPVKIDDSYLKVTYDVSVVIDTLSGKYYKDRVISLIGKDWDKTYGEGEWKDNMSVTFDPDGSKGLYRIEHGLDKVICTTVFRNKKEGTIINLAIFPLIMGELFRYEEKQPRFFWNLSGDSKEIDGYWCQKAVCRYCGREWTVWFSPEIPADCGLWKFSGLPGLILEAYDERKDYVFTVRTILQESDPIVRYGKYGKAKVRKMSREEFRKTERHLYEEPVLYTQGASGSLFYMDAMGGQGYLQTVFTADNLTYPYNPMELE